MKIYALNDMQSHCESVKKNVSLVGSVVLRGIEIYGIIQLLEGSHRMAYAIELGLPATIVLFSDDEVVPHDCDDIESAVTGLPDYATAGELARALIIERGLYMYKVPVYESDDYSNIDIIKPVGETGKALYSQLISCSPFSVFPQKVWEVVFGELKDVVGKNVLVYGGSDTAKALEKLNAEVSFINAALYPSIKAVNLDVNQFDLIYSSDFQNATDLCELLSTYKKLLKDNGLAVTINGIQTPELISDTGLEMYAFFETREERSIVSFLKKNA